MLLSSPIVTTTCVHASSLSYSVKRQDGSAVMRVDIALGKAYGALSMVRAYWFDF